MAWHSYRERPPLQLQHRSTSFTTATPQQPLPMPSQCHTPYPSPPSSSPAASPKSAKQPTVPARRVAETQLQLDIGCRVITIPLRHVFFCSFDDIPAETAASLICHQAEQLFIRYNAVTRQLTVSNMSSPHNAARDFIDFSLSAMITAGFLSGDHLFRNNMVGGFLDIQSETMVAGFRGPYATSFAQPDVAIRNQRWRNPLPGFVVETGFSEEYSELLDDKDMWLVGGDGRVCTVLLINIDESCTPLPPGRHAPTRVVPLPGSASQNPVDSDSESETGFFDKSFSPTEEAPAVPDGQLFTGFMELWRFVKERGSKDNPHAAAVCAGRAVLISGRVAIVCANIS
ncbi:hypothetical protein BDD12DRAFT_331156 [Trichophaea hybrida]|nr:hypothetical protein BDD12DRAFT_331156 [Trichophaea hybrida]